MKVDSTKIHPSHLVTRPFANAEDALDSILACLKTLVPYKLWMVTRVKDNDWTVVRCVDDAYGVTAGRVFRWTDSMCSRMVKGEGPMFAEHVQDISNYADAHIHCEMPLPIGAYIGLPILIKDKELFGTLCAMDPSGQPPLTQKQKDLIITLARSLSTLQTIYAEAETQKRKAEKYRYEAETDALTKVFNRRGWHLALDDQEQATCRTAQNAMVVIIDLDDLKRVNDSRGHSAGDELLISVAATLKGELRQDDVIARLGGDEFGILASEVSIDSAKKLFDRLKAALNASGINASMGYALRLSHSTMSETIRAADQAMYLNKNQKQKTS